MYESLLTQLVCEPYSSS